VLTYNKHTNMIPKRIVIWGLRKKYHTHRHIHQAFFKNAQKLKYDVIWVEDEKENQKHIQPGDIIISAEVYGKMVPKKVTFSDYNLPIRDDVKYCLHNFQTMFTSKLKQENFINLAVYNNDSEKADVRIDTARYFDTKTRTLHQPWGTDLLAHEFKKPVYRKNRFVFWIGSVWNNPLNQGNIQQIEELKIALRKYKLTFIRLRFIPDFLNTFFIRLSRIAPAISGHYQVEVNYLPCRVFKNISYGQLGLTNVHKFSDILGDSFILAETIEQLVEKGIALNKEDYIKLTEKQQECIKKYTYKESIEYIVKALSGEIENQF